MSPVTSGPTPDPRPAPRPGPRWSAFAVVAVIALSFNLRPVATAVGPVLEEIRTARHGEVVKAAVEMVKYFPGVHAQTVALEKQGMLPASTQVEITQAAKDRYPLLAEFVQALEGADIRTATTQATMYPNLLDIMSAELPNLASGAMTPEQFAQALTDGAAKNK